MNPPLIKSLRAPLSKDIADYPDGIVIPIDKPFRWSSADVIRKVKFVACRHFGTKKLKVGHAGTLDPLATGILLLCIGNACKSAESLQASHKEYIAGLCLGSVSASYDREKEAEAYQGTADAASLNEEDIMQVLETFIGPQDQLAPLFSAKQVDGIRSYELARKLWKAGKKLDEEAARLLSVSRIEISSIELLSLGDSEPNCVQIAIPSSSAAEWKNPSERINLASLPEGSRYASIKVGCSKGTYIRALARDIGEKLGCGAMLSSLRRTSCGAITLDDAVTVDALLSEYFQ